MDKKILLAGATGMVGQRFLTLLENHPWFEVIDIAASEKSKDKTWFTNFKNPNNNWYS